MRIDDGDRQAGCWFGVRLHGQHASHHHRVPQCGFNSSTSHWRYGGHNGIVVYEFLCWAEEAIDKKGVQRREIEVCVRCAMRYQHTRGLR